MLEKRNYKVFLIIILVLIMGINVFLLLTNKHYETLDINKEKNYDEKPIYIDHMREFNVIQSNYIEKYYERYLDYKKKHPTYSDDTIITYVNIGIDRPFYMEMESTNLSDGILMICNKYYALSSDYVPEYVEIGPNYGWGLLVPEAVEHFMKMVDDAQKDNVILKNASAYREYSFQQQLYNSYVNRDGRELADTYSARPGNSEHQTGLATDINSVSWSFENTQEYTWLINNSYKYGFILRYPKNKTFITGYQYEPWHYRYVGEEAAKYIYEHDITFEEYYATFILKG